MNKYPIWIALAAGAMLTGCAAVKEGREDVSYYYSNREAKGIAPARPAAAPAAATNGPAGVARIVYFDFDKWAIRPEDRSIVDAHANYLRSRPDAKLVLEGHADERGGREYNIGLGQRRSDAVRQALELLGVQSPRMDPVSWGMERPASLERTEQGYQLNRRVEFSYH